MTYHLIEVALSIFGLIQVTTTTLSISEEVRVMFYPKFTCKRPIFGSLHSLMHLRFLVIEVIWVNQERLSTVNAEFTIICPLALRKSQMSTLYHALQFSARVRRGNLLVEIGSACSVMIITALYRRNWLRVTKLRLLILSASLTAATIRGRLLSNLILTISFFALLTHLLIGVGGIEIAR